MKRIVFAALIAAFSLLTAQADDVMKKNADGTYVVTLNLNDNTLVLGAE